MSVPLFEITSQNRALEAQLKSAFDRVLQSGGFILGKEVEGFEKEVAQYIEASHAIGVTSGTDAILLALMALEIGPGDEVLCPTFTFFATAGCIARVGATPVFVDACADSFNIDIDDARGKISSRTRAIIPVHLFGQSADMDAVMELAKEHRLAVIEDVAQSLGARYKDSCVGIFGDFGPFSFFPTKNLGGFGDGGLVSTNDPALAQKAKVLRGHGAVSEYHHKYVGGNFRLDALQAALLRVKLPHLDTYSKLRGENAAFYNKSFLRISGACLASKADPADARLLLPTTLPHCTHIWNQYTIRVPGGRRDALKEHLTKKGIGAKVYYPLCLDKQECFQGRSLGEQSIRTAHMLSEQCLSLPIYPELSQAQKDEVVDAVVSFFKK